MTQTVNEPARDVPVVEEVDVLVVGGGVAGCAAAWAAATAGARTLMVERNGCLGGVATASLMANIGNLFLDAEERQVIYGFPGKLVDRLAEAGAASPRWKSRDVPGVTLDSEKMKVVMIDMLQEAGVQIFTHALGCRPIMADDAVTGCFIESKSGRQAVVAGTTIDCSGEADIAVQAGAATKSFRHNASTLLEMGNVDVDAFVRSFAERGIAFPDRSDFVRDYATFRRNWEERGVLFFPHVSGARGDWPFLNEILERSGFERDLGCPEYEETRMGMYGIRGAGMLAINANKYTIAQLDIRDLSRFELHAQQMCYRTAELLNQYMPGFENAHVAHIGVDLGIRISRYIQGRATLNGRDCRGASGPTFCDDVIATNPVRDANWTDGKPVFNYTCDVPFGVTVPKGCHRLLVGSAKSISTEPAGIIRGMTGCMVCGQATGVAGALAAQRGTEAADVPIRRLQQELLRQGAYLGDDDRLGELGLGRC